MEHELFLALKVGHIAGVALDVVSEEPLPLSHQFWGHSKVFITPHIASLTNPATAASSIAQNIKRAQEGKVMIGLIDTKDYS